MMILENLVVTYTYLLNFNHILTTVLSLAMLATFLQPFLRQLMTIVIIIIIIMSEESTDFR